MKSMLRTLTLVAAFALSTVSFATAGEGCCASKGGADTESAKLTATQCQAKAATCPVTGGADTESAKLTAAAEGKAKACCTKAVAAGEKACCAVVGGADKESGQLKAEGKMKECCTKAVAAGGKACCAVVGGADKESSQTAAGDKEQYKVGQKVQDFAVQTLDGKNKKLSELAGSEATVLIFWNQQCPFVKEVEGRVNEFTTAMKDKGVNVVVVDAGTNNSAEDIKGYAKDKAFPILVNPTSEVAAKFGATVTPEVFILNKNKEIVYHGAFDSGKRLNSAGNRDNFAQEAVQAVLNGEEPLVKETRAFGCSLKYAEGKQPTT